MLKKTFTFHRASEFLIEIAIIGSGIISIIIVGLIFLFLIKEGFSLFKVAGLGEFLLGKKWYPISEPPQFGILPFILGFFLIIIGPGLLSIPLGGESAVNISEKKRQNAEL